MILLSGEFNVLISYVLDSVQRGVLTVCAPHLSWFVIHACCYLVMSACRLCLTLLLLVTRSLQLYFNIIDDAYVCKATHGSLLSV